MPYIICVNLPGCLPEADPVAVATIEEARTTALDEVDRASGVDKPGQDWDDRFRPFEDDAKSLPESGGVIGPLPDGYVIDVQYVTDQELLGRVLAERGNVVTDASRSGVVDAYNQQ